MKHLLFSFVFMSLQFVTPNYLNAQSTDSTTVFGYVVPKPKLDSNGNPKRVFKPAFKRLGFTTGALLPFNGGATGSTSGLRFEYGLSNKASLLLDFQGNRSQDTTFSGGQVGLLFRSMPFASRRLQPYFGAGWSIGGGRTRGNYGRGRGHDFYILDTDSEGVLKHYAVGQVGVNYIVFKRIIASLEGNYQLQVGGTNAQKQGGASVKLGLAYQFGKKK
ncbi:MAG: hypothetical protein U5L45_24190 [Saprospiraceae bacterium]|nr:hypothetical protein [Saprospiraceae bacterium]